MANVVIFDEVTNRVLKYLKSVHTPDYSPRPDAIVNPDISGFSGIEPKYWKHVNGSIAEMNQGEKDARDAAAVANKIQNTRQAVIGRLNSPDGALLKATLLVILDEMNLQHGTNRTPAQFLNAIVAKINAGDVD